MMRIKNIAFALGVLFFGSISSQTRTVTTTGGTLNYTPLWNGTTNQSSSVIYQKNTKIGIGTTNPSSKFEVAEFIRFDSTLKNTSYGYQTLNSSPSGGGNTAIGYFSQYSMAGGANNIAVGGYTMQSMTSGYENTAMGMEAMRYANANRNAAFGISCLPTVTGDYNVAIGYGAGRNTTSGVANIAIGDEAMSSYANGYHCTGRRNIGIGGEAVIDNEAGYYNIGIGDFTINKNRNSCGNVAVGSEALRVIMDGYNTAVGFNAAKLDTAGTNNLFLGAYSGTYQRNITGKIYIGTRDYTNATLENTRTPIIISSHATDSSQTSIRMNGVLMLPIGAGASKVLSSDASGNASWATLGSLGAGTVTSIATGNGITGGTITTTGTLGLSGATGDIGSFSGTNTYSAITAPSTTGSYLRSAGASTKPVWSTLILPNSITANNVAYGSATNTIGSSSNFTFDGTNVSIGGATATTLLTVSQQTNIQTPMSGSTMHVVGANGSPLRITLDTHNNNSNFGGIFLGRRSRGSSSAPSSVQSGDVLFSVNVQGYGTSQYPAASTGLLAFKAAENFTNTANGTQFSIFTTPTGSVTAAEVFRVAASGAITIGTWNGSVIPLTYGGTNANLTASNGGIFYSTATAGAILSGTATAGQILRSGSSAAPSWSTATYPATTTANRLLYSSATNTISDNSLLTFDGTTFTANGVTANASGVGLGTGTASATNTINGVYNTNGTVQYNIQNTNTSTAARAGWNCSNSTNSLLFMMVGTGYTTSGANTADAGLLACGGTAGLNIAAYNASGTINLYTGGISNLRANMNSSGRMFFGGSTSATALVHLAAGTATASTAPLKFTSGTNLTTAEAGAMEYNGTNLFFTRTGTTRENVLTTSSVNSVSPTSPNRTITVVIDGTTYYIAAKTTND